MSGPAPLPDLVVVHPLVLLSTVDHYNRVALGGVNVCQASCGAVAEPWADTNKRVVGVLLGTTHKGKIDITNTYAIPFEEDPKDPNVWFLDHIYHEKMYAMFRKVNSKTRFANRLGGRRI